METFYLSEKISSNAVHPMVSFSERYLKTIDKKTITYGKFGIAMKKKWVRNNKIHPVLYIDRTSQLAIALSDLLKARRSKADSKLPDLVRHSIMTIKCFTKNTKGYNSFLKETDFNFKDEKEWRFVPTKEQISGNLISESRIRYEKNPDFYNDKLRNFPLVFKLTDIQYLFVENERQRDEIANTFAIDPALILVRKWSTE